MVSELLPCPFCGGAMRVREHTAFHPQNDCWLSGKEICDFDYMSWNTRATPSAEQKVGLWEAFAQNAENMQNQAPGPNHYKNLPGWRLACCEFARQARDPDFLAALPAPSTASERLEMRDPRIEPQSGDVMIGPPGSVVEGQVRFKAYVKHYGISYQYRDTDQDGWSRPMRASIRDWRMWGAIATEVRPAPPIPSPPTASER